jgi:hypothetical protein
MVLSSGTDLSEELPIEISPTTVILRLVRFSSEESMLLIVSYVQSVVRSHFLCTFIRYLVNQYMNGNTAEERKVTLLYSIFS